MTTYVNINWKKFRPKEFEYRGRWIDNWFSNFKYCNIYIGGIKWPSVENYYQAMKSEDEADHFMFSKMTPAEAKFHGKRIDIREDWDLVKYDIMKKALYVKFTLPEWKEKLLSIAGPIIEWNNWNDKIWGVSINDNQGQNLLGQILMEIRDELKTKI